jgi:hypothetical protein
MYQAVAPALCSLESSSNIRLIAFGEGGVDQKFLPVSPEYFSGAHNSLKGTGRLSEIVVDFGIRAIKRQRNHFNIGFFHLLADFVRN